MHTIAEQPSVARFQENLQNTIHRFKPSRKTWLVPVVLIKVHLLLILNKMAIRELRKAMEACSLDCSSKCQTDVYELTSEIRGDLTKLERLLPDGRFFSYSKGQIQNLIYDWDDLAEDAYISKDAEYQELIGKLESKL